MLRLSNQRVSQAERRLQVAEREAGRKTSEFEFKSGPVKQQAAAYTTHRQKANARNQKYRQ